MPTPSIPPPAQMMQFVMGRFVAHAIGVAATSEIIELSPLKANSIVQLVLQVCQDSARFQKTYLPHRDAVLPLSTLLSSFALYKKLKGAKDTFASVLEIGPGCGYLS